jgi:hypothetical protein
MILQIAALGLGLLLAGSQAQAWDLVSENDDGGKTYSQAGLVWTGPNTQYYDLAEADRYCRGKLDRSNLWYLTAGLSEKMKFRLPTSDEAVAAIQSGLTGVLPFDYDPHFWAGPVGPVSVSMDASPGSQISAYDGAKVRYPVRCVADLVNASSAAHL